MKKEFALYFQRLMLVILASLLLTSCMKEKEFKWETIKLSHSELQLSVGEEKEIFLYGVPTRFSVDWLSTDRAIASAKSCEYLSRTAGSEKMVVRIVANTPGRVTLTARVTCPKNVKKELPLTVIVEKQ